MAGYRVRAAGRALGVVLLAVAAILAATARAAGDDDEHVYHWKCFKSCTNDCRPDEVDAGSGISSGGKCKDRCLDDCFEDLPAVCYQQCVVKNCLHLPPYSKDKMTCMKKCCDKCFHPKPGPKPKPPPGPAPKPKPPTPGPSPKPPKPPAPKAPPPPRKPCPPTGHDMVMKPDNN